MTDLITRLDELAVALIAGKRVCTPKGPAHKPLIRAGLLSAPEMAIDALVERSDRIEALERAVDVARQIIEEIGLTASGCAATHGDSGGGLEMINGYAEDAFRVLSDALSPSGGEAA